MLEIRLVCVGRLKEAYLREAFAEYEKRLSKYCTLQVIEIQEERLPDRPSQAEINAALGREAEKIARHLKGQAVALCVEGVSETSKGMADILRRAGLSGTSALSFVIGSSHGLAESIKKKADIRLSLSAMTFPHQLFRVMLAEQIYRAQSILAGSKYHK